MRFEQQSTLREDQLAKDLTAKRQRTYPQGQGQGQGLDHQGQGQGQGLDPQGQGQGQGLKICPRGQLKAKDNNTAWSRFIKYLKICPKIVSRVTNLS